LPRRNRTNILERTFSTKESLVSQQQIAVVGRRTSSSSVLERAFEVLSTFNSAHPQRSMMDIAVETGLPKSTVHRLLKQLVDLGVLERAGLYYRLGPRLFTLGSRSAEEGVRRLAMPHLLQLHRASRLGVSIVVLTGSQVLPLQRVGINIGSVRKAADAERAPVRPPSGGGMPPLHCSAAGKLLLSFAGRPAVDAYAARGLTALTPRSIVDDRALRRELAAIAKSGIATEDRENFSATKCMSAPVLVDRKAVAAVSLIMPATMAWRPAATSQLREAAVHITRALERSGLRSVLEAEPRHPLLT
jgi:DNA-binding IclR family transcriptional regulator